MGAITPPKVPNYIIISFVIHLNKIKENPSEKYGKPDPSPFNSHAV